MNNKTLEIIRALVGTVAAGENVIFDEQLLYPAGIAYDDTTGIITFKEIGEYVIHWWVAMETTLRGAVGFTLVSSLGDLTKGSSPQKTGQVSGFGAIDVTAPGTTLSLVNKTEYNTSLSRPSLTKASLLITPVENVGPTSADGRSAYQIAVDEGFVGTEEEWLASLVGATGPQGETGAAGADGRSAYQVAVDDGYEGTEEEWLASLVGPTGPQGDTGPEGPKGEPGKPDAGTLLSFANYSINDKRRWKPLE